MKLEISILQEFGQHLADGSRAAEFRMGRIDPYMSICPEVVLDFTGVRAANSSFINALVCGLVEHHGKRALNILVFKGCNPVVRVLVEAAVALGLQKANRLVKA
ncbi:MAG: STAS-like domain-containing protein [Verrucomicrobiae bacterium]|nr:STAS-like domain-containing protein [Verrucomicrobiae bacterium]